MSQCGISIPLCRAIKQMAQPSTHRLRPLRFGTGTYITKKIILSVNQGPMSFKDRLFEKLKRTHSNAKKINPCKLFLPILSKQSRSEYTESTRCVSIILAISKEKSQRICRQSFYYKQQNFFLLMLVNYNVQLILFAVQTEQ